ncbi:MAG TPA: hypothetical protein ENN40_10455 [Candidatus Aminicenantes bacterium]|nr:hypothetical protein [Candidatus Aminicenantes bacterium]
MASQPDPAFRYLASVLILVLLIAGVRRLTRTPHQHPRILPGSAPLLCLPEGQALSLGDALPPDGSGCLLLCRFPRNPDSRLQIGRAWQWALDHNPGRLRAVFITRRPDRVRNLAAWMRIPSPLWMEPEILYDRLRIPGLPILLYFAKGELKKCRLLAR